MVIRAQSAAEKFLWIYHLEKAKGQYKATDTPGTWLAHWQPTTRQPKHWPGELKRLELHDVCIVVDNQYIHGSLLVTNFQVIVCDIPVPLGSIHTIRGVLNQLQFALKDGPVFSCTFRNALDADIALRKIEEPIAPFAFSYFEALAEAGSNVYRPVRQAIFDPVEEFNRMGISQVCTLIFMS